MQQLKNTPSLTLIKPDFDWYVFFSVLIPNFSEKVNIQISEEQIELRGSIELIKNIHKQLQKTLLDPEHFFKDLPYNVQLPQSHAKAYTLKELIGIPLPAENDLHYAKKIILNLFGKTALEALALNLEQLFPENKSTAEAGVIYSKPASNKKIALAWQATLEALLSQFNHIELTQLRRAYLHSDQSLPLIEDEQIDSTSSIAEGVAKQCFGVQKTQTSWKVYFDYIRMHQFLFPPKFLIETTEETAKLSFSRSHFMSYFQQISQGGMLLRLYQDEQQAVQARPIITTLKQSINKPKHFTLIIDKSGSMELDFPELKIRLKEFIEKLEGNYPDATIRLVFFDLTSTAQDFSLKDLTEIKYFINQQATGFTTRLIGTLQDEFQNLLAQQKTDSHQTTVILFTDGVNNEEPKNTSILETSLKKSSEKPLLFCIGAGNNYDEKFLNTLSTTVGGEFHHISQIKEFEVITARIPAMQYAKKLLEFLITAGKEQKKYTIPVSMNDAPHVTELLVPFKNESLTIEQFDKKIEFKRGTSISATLPIDKILKLRDQYYEVLEQVRDNELPFIKAIGTLELIQEKLSSIVPPENISHQPYELVKQLQIQISSAIKTLQSSDTNQASKFVTATLSNHPNLQIEPTKISKNTIEYKKI